jgi:hypothetical protein
MKTAKDTNPVTKPQLD